MKSLSTQFKSVNSLRLAASPTDLAWTCGAATIGKRLKATAVPSFTNKVQEF